MSSVAKHISNFSLIICLEILTVSMLYTSSCSKVLWVNIKYSPSDILVSHRAGKQKEGIYVVRS